MPPKASSAPYDGVVALGCVIQGETYHFDIVSNESARGADGLDASRASSPSATASSPSTTKRRRWRARRLDEPQQGRRRRARGAGDDRAQAQPGGQIDGQERAASPTRTRARPTSAARRGWPRCRRSTRWISPAPALNEILAEFESHWLGREVEGAQYLPAEAAFFRDIVSGVVREQRKLDPLIDEALAKSWPLKRIEAVLRAALRAGAYELDHRRDVPARVVVSEYADVAAAFVERDETGMVNAVLDQLARKLRAAEFDRAR